MIYSGFFLYSSVLFREKIVSFLSPLWNWSVSENGNDAVEKEWQEKSDLGPYFIASRSARNGLAERRNGSRGRPDFWISGGFTLVTEKRLNNKTKKAQVKDFANPVRQNERSTHNLQKWP